MEGLIISSVGAEDFATLADLHGRCLDPAWNVESISGLFDSPGAMGLIARFDGAPVGFALCRQARDESEVLALGVVEEQRRRGIARALLDAALAGCATDGVRALFLEVAEDNQAGRALYAATGFAVVGRRADYYRRGGSDAVAALVLRRDITSSSDT